MIIPEIVNSANNPGVGGASTGLSLGPPSGGKPVGRGGVLGGPPPASGQHQLSGAGLSFHLISGNKYYKHKKKYQECLTREERQKEYRRRCAAHNRVLIQALRGAGRYEEGNNVAWCGRLQKYQCSSCGGEAARRSSISCGNRGCAWCARERQERLIEKCAASVAEFSNPVMLTLTMKPRVDPEAAREDVWAAWNRFWRFPEVKAAFAGVHAFYEVTYNPLQGYHGHLHCIADGRMVQDRLAWLWWRACQDGSRICWIKWIPPHERNSSLRYVSKYASKVVDAEDPSVLLGILDDMEGKRLYRTYGTAYAVDDKDLEGPPKDEGEEYKAAALSCPHCHAEGTMVAVPYQFVSMEVAGRRPGGWYVPDD